MGSPRRLLSALALCGATVLAPVTVIGAPAASALSCVMAETVAQDAVHLFTGRIVDSRDDRVLVEVERVRPGEEMASRVWLEVSLGSWMPWRPGTAGPLGDTTSAPAHGVPEHYSDPRTWLFAADKDWGVNACSAWPGEFRQLGLQPVTGGLLPVAQSEETSTDPATGGAEDASPEPDEVIGANGLSTAAKVWSGVGGLALGVLMLAVGWTISPLRRRRLPR